LHTHRSEGVEDLHDLHWQAVDVHLRDTSGDEGAEHREVRAQLEHCAVPNQIDELYVRIARLTHHALQDTANFRKASVRREQTFRARGEAWLDERAEVG